MTTLREMVDSYNHDEVMLLAAEALVKENKKMFINDAQRGVSGVYITYNRDDTLNMPIIFPGMDGEVCVDVDGLGKITVCFDVRNDSTIVIFKW